MQKNFAAVDTTLARLHEVRVPDQVTSPFENWSLLCWGCSRPSVRPPRRIASSASPLSSTATLSKSTASAFASLASTPPKAASSACGLRANDGDAGQRASFALADRIGRASVSCRPRDLDRYGRVVAVCFKGNEDLNRWMVANGWAAAYRRYSGAYVAEEDSVRRGRVNIWSGAFEMPWEWRAQHRDR